MDELAKGAAVGKPISATDDRRRSDLHACRGHGDDQNVDETTLFAINDRTGQITTKSKLDSNADGADGDDEDTHTVMVTVVDPSGADASVTVVITVKNVNDPPAFASDALKTLWVTENTTDLRTDETDTNTGLGATPYAATDDDESDPPADGSLDLFVGGTDKGAFDLSDDGALTFDDHTPNYEGQKEYSITLMVEDDEFALGTHDVTVTVVNAEDDGEVSLNAREPQVGKVVLATLDDKDGTVRGQSWKWYRNATDSTTTADLTDELTACDDDDPNATALCRIDGAASPAYTPAAADAGKMLAARVSYTDGFVMENDDGDDVGDSAHKLPVRVVQISDPANTAPKFADDQDPNTPGKQAVAEREVAENMKTAVGNPVIAFDIDLLMYSVDDTTNFSVDGDGQISTAVELDYEGLPEDAKYYMVMLMATDPSGAFDTIMVKITVTDGPDDAIIAIGPAENTAPAFADDAETDFMVYENMYAGAAVGTVTASDEDGDTLTYSADDSGYFDVDNDGNITTAMMLDHEAMPSHTVTVTASDGEDDGHHRSDDRGR